MSKERSPLGCAHCGGTSWWRHDPVRPLRARPVQPGPWRCWACDGPADGIYDPETMGLAISRHEPPIPNLGKRTRNG